MFLLGYDEFNSQIYRCYDAMAQKLVVSRDVKFLNENNNGIELNFDDQVREHISNGSNGQTSSSTNSSSNSSTNSSTNIHLTTSSSTSSSTPIEISSETSSENEQEQPRRSDRRNKGIPPDRYGYDNVSAKYMDWYKNYGEREKDDTINAIVEPKTYEEVLQDKNKNDWVEAMQDEINSMNINETWELVPAPIDKNIIGSKWLFKIKMNERNEIDRYKAR